MISRLRQLAYRCLRECRMGGGGKRVIYKWFDLSVELLV